MPSASAIRLQIESALAHKIPSALTPAAKLIRPVAATGVPALDAALDGGLPVGAISELCGPECSGRTGVTLSFVARLTHNHFCAWIDAGNALDPLSAAAAGVNLKRMLWVRCGAEKQQAPHGHRFALPQQCFTAPPIIKGLHGGGHGNHPRQEVKGMAEAVGGLFASRHAEPTLHKSTHANGTRPQQPQQPHTQSRPAAQRSANPWTPLEQALRACDLLLQTGGFRAIVLDMGGIAPEHASRIPLATWFRYRAAAERTQTSFLLLTQTSCAKSSAELLLRFEPAQAVQAEPTVFTGMQASVAVARRRFAPADENVTPFRKPPQSDRTSRWTSRAAWAGQP
ncbi:MAG: recombinase RecA [Acidobacteriaceae bacterium]